MKLNLSITAALLGIMILAGMACSKSSSNGGSTTVCNGVSATFAANVLPLIQTKCAINSGCHANGSSNSGGALTTYAQISAKASNIKTSVSNGSMPQTGTLTAAEKNIILCWISNGSLNN